LVVPFELNMSTPEEASEYLARTNFKSIIEWVTAEAVLHRPDDPVSFVRNILEAKVDARGGQVLLRLVVMIT